MNEGKRKFLHDKKKHLLIVHNFCKDEMDSLVDKAFGGTRLVNSLVEFGSIGGVDNVVDSTSGLMAVGDKDKKNIDKDIQKETCRNNLLREEGSAVDRFIKTLFWNFQKCKADLCYILIDK